MILKQLDTTTHEGLFRVDDAATGLRCFIAIHSTLLGPAVGGARFRPYASDAEAIEDVLRLARGMTYKNAVANLPFGGGKAAIIGDPRRQKTPELLRAFGRAIDALDGRFWSGEDMGVNPADIDIIAGSTRFVAGGRNGAYSSGNPAPHTALGVFRGIRAAARRVFGADDLRDRIVAIQGLGNVGSRLAALLHEAGARLVVVDTDSRRTSEAASRYGAATVEPDAIYDADADFFAPCAMGGVLNDATIPRLKVRAVAGSANNQLAAPEHGARLHEAGILYAPDYVVNAGGAVSVAAEILRVQDRDVWMAEKMAAISETLERILEQAKVDRTQPELIADRIAENRLKAASTEILKRNRSTNLAHHR